MPADVQFSDWVFDGFVAVQGVIDSTHSYSLVNVPLNAGGARH